MLWWASKKRKKWIQIIKPCSIHHESELECKTYEQTSSFRQRVCVRASERKNDSISILVSREAVWRSARNAAFVLRILILLSFSFCIPVSVDFSDQRITSALSTLTWQAIYTNKINHVCITSSHTFVLPKPYTIRKLLTYYVIHALHLTFKVFVSFTFINLCSFFLEIGCAGRCVTKRLYRREMAHAIIWQEASQLSDSGNCYQNLVIPTYLKY